MINSEHYVYNCIHLTIKFNGHHQMDVLQRLIFMRVIWKIFRVVIHRKSVFEESPSIIVIIVVMGIVLTTSTYAQSVSF